MATFNGTFYATSATVIPVLFLALTLQGDFILNAIIAAKRWIRTARRRQPPLNNGWKATLLEGLGQVVNLFGYLVLLYGAFGEYAAMQALETQHTSPSTQSIVMRAVVWLATATVAAFLVHLVQAQATELSTEHHAASDGGETDKPPAESE